MKTSVRRCLSVMVAALAVSSMVTVAISGEIGPASPTGEAEAVDILTDSQKRSIAAGAYDGAEIVSLGLIADNEVSRENLITKNEVNETKVNINGMFATQRQNNQILTDSYNNYLEDTQQIGTLEAMNAYVRALNNGTAEAESRNLAKQAYRDYYTVKQIQRDKQWNVTVETMKTAVLDARQSNFSASSFYYTETNPSNINFALDSREMRISVSDLNSTATYTAANGTVRTVSAPTLLLETYDTSDGSVAGSEKIQLDPTTDMSGVLPENSATYNVQIQSFKVKGTSTVSDARLFYRQDWDNVRERIKNQTDALDQRMDNIVNQTFSSYQQGEINNSDLVSPLQIARNYSPDQDGEYGTYTLATLTSMGKSAPTNLSQTKTMNITAGGVDYRGILLSDGLPPSGEFTVGTTYNTSDITGEQLIQTSDGLVTIPNYTDFSITSVEGPDGEQLNQSAVGYSNPSYESTNISEYQETMDELREMQAQINARQANLSTAGSGGGFLSGDLFSGLSGLFGMGLSGGAVALIIGGVVVLLFSRS